MIVVLRAMRKEMGVLFWTMPWYSRSEINFGMTESRCACSLILGTSIAGHYRTNPWVAVPDWPWCRNADAGLSVVNLTENWWCRTELFISISASVHVHCPDPCCMTKSVLHVHVHAAYRCPYFTAMSMLHVHINDSCPCVHIYRNAGMAYCPASSQSSPGLKKNNDAVTGRVQD